MQRSTPSTTTTLVRAKALARRRHRPVYVRGDDVYSEKPAGRVLTVWPSGDITMTTSSGGSPSPARLNGES